jgi:hypothetical protein
MILAEIEVPEHFIVDALFSSGKCGAVRKISIAVCKMRPEERERDRRTAEDGSPPPDMFGLLNGRSSRPVNGCNLSRYRKAL